MSTGGSRLGAGRPAIRPAAKNYCRLDIRVMCRNGWIRPNWKFHCPLLDTAGWYVGHAECEVDDGARCLMVQYDWKKAYESMWQSTSNRIWLAATPCHYGGERWWFSCPCCQRRAAVLYVMGWQLQCGTCSRVSYSTQRSCPITRAWIQIRKLEARLLDGRQKPKRMRWETYYRLLDQIAAHELRRNHALVGVVSQLRRRIYAG